jgi:predicted exporter
LSIAEARRTLAPGILWSAFTSVSAFLVLNLSVLPGLGQLGSLVGIGIALASVVMLFGFLPVVRRLSARNAPEKFLLFRAQRLMPRNVGWVLSVVFLGAAVVVLWQKGLSFDNTANVLRPKRSEASATLEDIHTRIRKAADPLWVIVAGETERIVEQRLDRLGSIVGEARSKGLVDNFVLPTAVWPRSEWQGVNRHAARTLVDRREDLRTAALNAGFTTNALALTEGILGHWRRALDNETTFWPSNRMSRWILGKVVARSPEGFLAIGSVDPKTNRSTRLLMDQWPGDLRREGILLCGWTLLGESVFATVMGELPRLIIPVLVVVIVSLWLAFRSFREVALSLMTLAFSGIVLAAIMSVIEWRWNLLNIMAVPLLLGMGVDFSIHIQLALRREGGNRRAVQVSTGRALLLAGTTTAAGFVSLAFSSNGGMASLGKVCALGIAIALLTAIYLLPVWHGRSLE